MNIFGTSSSAYFVVRTIPLCKSNPTLLQQQVHLLAQISTIVEKKRGDDRLKNQERKQLLDTIKEIYNAKHSAKVSAWCNKIMTSIAPPTEEAEEQVEDE